MLQRCRILPALLLSVGVGLASVPAVVAREIVPQATEFAQSPTIAEMVETAENLASEDNLEAAIAQYERVLARLRQQGDREGAADILNRIGLLHVYSRQYRVALDRYNQALQIYRDTGNIALEAYLLTSIGDVYKLLLQDRTALDYYQQALPLRRDAELPLGVAATLNNMAGAYRNLGEFQQALESYREALDIYRNRFSPRNEAIVSVNLGRLYENLGDWNSALELYRQARPAYALAGDEVGVAEVTFDLGTVYAHFGETEKALEYLREALQSQEKLDDEFGKAITLTHMGRVFADRGEPDRALARYRAALPLYRHDHQAPLKAYALVQMGRSYAETGQTQSAIARLEEGLQLARAVEARPIELDALYFLGRLERDRQNYKAAIALLEPAIALVESRRANIANPQLRATYFASYQDIYQLYIDALMQRHQSRPNAGYDRKALAVSERSRARTLLELLEEAQVNLREGVNSELLEQEKALQQRLERLETRQQELATQPEGEASELEREIETLLDEYQRVRSRIRATSPRYAAITQPQPLSPDEIQSQVLDDDTALLSYSLGERRSYLWVVTTETVRSYELPSRDTIETAALQFRRTIAAPRTRINPRRVSEVANRIFDLILAPAFADLDRPRLAIVADGALQYIPFSAIAVPNEAGERVPLVVARETVMLPSASTLAIARSQPRTSPEKLLAVFADPVFDTADDRLSTTETETGREVSPLTQRFESAARSANVAWTRLPYTRVEAETILNLVPPEQRLAALDFTASQDRLARIDLSQYRIVHFATHGYVDIENPELSGLVLSLFDRLGNPQNGYLQLHEVYNLDLNADLVVLSACQTGLGQQIRGEGLIGLTRGFMYAGASRAVVSLWQVDDRATAELMGHFYQALLQDNLSPAAALRSAQIELWQQRQWRSPYFWSAFVLQGEWR